MHKLLFYISRFPGYGGIETVTELIGNKFVSSGDSVSILTHIIDNSRRSDLIGNASVYLMPDGAMWDTVTNKAYALDLVRHHSYDIIIYQDSYSPTEHIAIEMAKSSGATLYVFEHSTPLFIEKSIPPFPPLPFYKIYQHLKNRYALINASKKRHILLLKASTKYVVLSEPYIKELCHLCGISVLSPLFKKITYIHNPVFSNEFPFQLEQKENIILFVGQLTEGKRVDLMLQVWSELSKRYSNWVFIIVGDGAQRVRLAEKCMRESISRVHFVGYQTPSSFYAKAKIFWMTSVFEGFPMTILESMQCGCVPVVMNTFSALKDIISNGVDGFISSNNIKSFIRANDYLLSNVELLSEMSKSARKKAKLFSIDSIFSYWLKLLEG